MKEAGRGFKLANDLKKLMMGGYPLVFVETQEEELFFQQLRAKLPMFAAREGKEERFYLFDPTEGFFCHQEKIDRVKTVADVLEFIKSQEGGGIFLLRDMLRLLPEDGSLTRRLINFYQSTRGRQKHLFLTASQWRTAPELTKIGYFLEFGLPDPEELKAEVNRHLQALAGKDWIQIQLAPGDIDQMVLSLRGLTLAEADHMIKKICHTRKVLDNSVLKDFFSEKKLLTRNAGCLEFVEPSQSMKDIGGLENLKEWLNQRKPLFSEMAREKGLKPPRGVLMMGMSGCGKSLSVKVISELWGLPLFRLDMGKVFGGVHGLPEEAFFNSLRMMESVAPAILWLDEMEMGINIATKNDTTGRIFAGFLTWLQEKKASVFVAATSNRIELLPAEVIRKGRFDQVFFVDFPNEEERMDVFRVHLEKRGYNPADFPLDMLAVSTANWNGAEIESAIENAMVEAFGKNRALGINDLWTIITRTVPLSITMSEQIKHIKDWATDRAVPATKRAVDATSVIKDMTVK